MYMALDNYSSLLTLLQRILRLNSPWTLKTYPFGMLLNSFPCLFEQSLASKVDNQYLISSFYKCSFENCNHRNLHMEHSQYLSLCVVYPFNFLNILFRYFLLIFHFFSLPLFLFLYKAYFDLLSNNFSELIMNCLHT